MCRGVLVVGLGGLTHSGIDIAWSLTIDPRAVWLYTWLGGDKSFELSYIL